jgi:heme-degrading monooxygenase HmoA
MIISVLTRKTRLNDRGEWQSRLKSVLPKINKVLDEEKGFVSVQYLWGTDEDGEMGQITTWETLEDCRRYVREGGAAMVATIEDAAMPTAPHPDGSWVRQTFEVVS